MNDNEIDTNNDPKPWQLLHGTVVLLATPEESVISWDDFEAWRS